MCEEGRLGTYRKPDSKWCIDSADLFLSINYGVEGNGVAHIYNSRVDGWSVVLAMWVAFVLCKHLIHQAESV